MPLLSLDSGEFVKNGSQEIDLQETEWGKYRIGSRLQISAEQLSKLSLVLSSGGKRSEVSGEFALGGRTSGACADLQGIGRIFVKHYARGGLFRYLVSDRFLSMGTNRAKEEFRILEEVRSLGISAPKPIAYLVEGNRFYRAWLVTEEIVNSQTLVALSLSDEGAVHDLIDEISRQFLLLIRNRILHIDLHPGNILIDDNRQVYFIDFDKAYEVKISRDELRDLYIRRWRRAVIKHKLPLFLNELISLKLRCADGSN